MRGKWELDCRATKGPIAWLPTLDTTEIARKTWLDIGNFYLNKSHSHWKKNSRTLAPCVRSTRSLPATLSSNYVKNFNPTNGIGWTSLALSKLKFIEISSITSSHLKIPRPCSSNPRLFFGSRAVETHGSTVWSHSKSGSVFLRQICNQCVFLNLPCI